MSAGAGTSVNKHPAIAGPQPLWIDTLRENNLEREGVGMTTRGPWRGWTTRLVAIALVLAAPAARAGCVLSDVVRDDARASAVKTDAAHTYILEDEVLETGWPSSSISCHGRAYLTLGAR